MSQFLQGAQKVLENLTQQQNQLAPTSQQPQTFTPSVTPGGPAPQQILVRFPLLLVKPKKVVCLY